MTKRRAPYGSPPKSPSAGRSVGRPAPSKYRACPTVVDGRRFASKAEARRYEELRLQEAAGVIEGLACQVRYPLTVNGQAVCVYVADFVYTDMRTGERVVEDVKGCRTDVYRLKARLMRAVWGIVIRETGAGS